MGKLTFGAGIWAFGQFVDRYAGDGYGPTRSSQQMIEDAARVPGPQHGAGGRPGAGLDVDLHFHGGGAGPQPCRSFPGEKPMMRNTLSAWFAAILVALLIAGVG